MEYKVTRPFLLALYRDYDNGLLKKDEFIEILYWTESFLMRRFICGFATNSLNSIFPKLYSDLINIKNRKGLNFVDAYKITLLSKKSSYKMPDDDEFIESFLKHNKKKHRFYILDKFENYGFNETNDLTDYSVEHIMPQTLSDEWKEYLGDDYEVIHMQYLELIGNITFTKYNSEMGNDSFDLKKEKGYSPSNLRLNKYLCNFDKWNQSTIIERTEFLAKKALEIWKYPTITSEVLNEYQQTRLD